MLVRRHVPSLHCMASFRLALTIPLYSAISATDIDSTIGGLFWKDCFVSDRSIEVLYQVAHIFKEMMKRRFDPSPTMKEKDQPYIVNFKCILDGDDGVEQNARDVNTI